MFEHPTIIVLENLLYNTQLEAAVHILNSPSAFYDTQGILYSIIRNMAHCTAFIHNHTKSSTTTIRSLHTAYTNVSLAFLSTCQIVSIEVHKFPL